MRARIFSKCRTLSRAYTLSLRATQQRAPINRLAGRPLDNEPTAYAAAAAAAAGACNTAVDDNLRLACPLAKAQIAHLGSCLPADNLRGAKAQVARRSLA